MGTESGWNKDDNIWVVDKAPTWHQVQQQDREVMMVLGRREELTAEHARLGAEQGGEL